jgi:hypothetical protein
MTIELGFGILASSSNLFPVWMQNHGIEMLWKATHWPWRTEVGSGHHGRASSTMAMAGGSWARQPQPWENTTLAMAGESHQSWPWESLTAARQVDLGSHGDAGA